MFWIICIVIQLILWWVTFFKSKKMIREKAESRWGTGWSEFTLSNERYKFPLGLVFIGLLLCFVPILGIFAVAFFTLGVSNMRNSDFEDERPVFAIVELFKKKI